MRTDAVVVAPPGLDDDAGLLAAAKPLEAQALVAELAANQRQGLTVIADLGLSTIAAEQEVTFNADGTATIIHDSVYTAANGDQLFSVVTATGVFLSPTLIALSDTEAFSGGTGRFVDAAGSANVAGVAQFTGPSGGVGMFSTQGQLAY
jgi:hypothetical protein